MKTSIIICLLVVVMTAVHAAPTNDINDILEMILGDIVDEQHPLDDVKGVRNGPNEQFPLGAAVKGVRNGPNEQFPLGAAVKGVRNGPNEQFPLGAAVKGVRNGPNEQFPLGAAVKGVRNGPNEQFPLGAAVKGVRNGPNEQFPLGAAVKGEQGFPLGYDNGDERKGMWTNTDKDDEDDDKLEIRFRRILAFLRRLTNKQG